MKKTKNDQNKCRITLRFLEHIFGSGKKEVDFGLDYLQLLYTKPKQRLPVLCLQSTERSTGKTTFVLWLKAIFISKIVLVDNSTLTNVFNSYWASKLIVCCDETKIDKRALGKIKLLCTADKILINEKGKYPVKIDYFGKFILTTNFEYSVYEPGDETRFWVRKIPSIAQGHQNVNLLNEMIGEIPAFLRYLSKRKMLTEERSRVWFDINAIRKVS